MDTSNRSRRYSDGVHLCKPTLPATKRVHSSSPNVGAQVERRTSNVSEATSSLAPSPSEMSKYKEEKDLL